MIYGTVPCVASPLRLYVSILYAAHIDVYEAWPPRAMNEWRLYPQSATRPRERERKKKKDAYRWPLKPWIKQCKSVGNNSNGMDERDEDIVGPLRE